MPVCISEVYVYVSVCMYVSMCMYVYVCLCIYVCICVCVSMCVLNLQSQDLRCFVLPASVDSHQRP